MSGDSPYWLFIAALFVSRAVYTWATTEKRSWLALSIAVPALLWLSAPTIANLSAIELKYWLSDYGKVICILACIEAWIMNRTFTRYSYLSPLSWVAIVYLQARLFQSGQLNVSFDAQSLLLAGGLILASLLLRLLSKPGLESGLLNRAHFAVIWISIWLGLCIWPDNTGINSTQNLRDTALLIATIPLLILFSTMTHYCWVRSSKFIRGLS